jgi:hypothetical protein
MRLSQKPPSWRTEAVSQGKRWFAWRSSFLMQFTESRMNKDILSGHWYPGIANESLQQLWLELQLDEG